MSPVSIHPVRVYADTSVYGGAFDPEFEASSTAFFELVRIGRFQLVYSALIDLEMQQAPDRVRSLFSSFQGIAELAEAGEEALQLRKAYLDAGIVSPKWSADALHVAVASVTSCRVIVSWNFKHIVHFQKIPLYNGINQSLGYAPIAIHSPEEVIAHED